MNKRFIWCAGMRCMVIFGPHIPLFLLGNVDTRTNLKSHILLGYGSGCGDCCFIDAPVWVAWILGIEIQLTLLICCPEQAARLSGTIAHYARCVDH